ncbi:molybdopterin synthase catalytic subunit MoaE [Thalassotalea sp. PS06]|uniref:molybdopterin synthase catalytic subunit MoaE n=1 Tax=Thalassotalea sp. PS06 TaxID=2594005 RepID=UPI001162A683|nr:molybdopterin synthase catalytic subunit MoaE [Thalassotalea sp. PS06]QDP00477.1 molybdopterin synthase catalytic subunit MoaE [Thalassotalea sp. PS06]
MNTKITIQTKDFSPGDEINWLEQETSGDGALVTFIGKVRDHNQGQEVANLFLEHYAGMAERCLENIADQARARWQVGKICIIHRVGELNINDNIVFVGVTSAHRQDAFYASQFIMDYLKINAPFWKKEQTPRGSRWVEAKQQDQSEAQKW